MVYNYLSNYNKNYEKDINTNLFIFQGRITTSSAWDCLGLAADKEYYIFSFQNYLLNFNFFKVGLQLHLLGIAWALAADEEYYIFYFPCYLLFLDFLDYLLFSGLKSPENFFMIFNSNEATQIYEVAQNIDFKIKYFFVQNTECNE